MTFSLSFEKFVTNIAWKTSSITYGLVLLTQNTTKT